MSWSLPFGIALRPLLPGTYCCNDLMLKAGQLVRFRVESLGLKARVLGSRFKV